MKNKIKQYYVVIAMLLLLTSCSTNNQLNSSKKAINYLYESNKEMFLKMIDVEKTRLNTINSDFTKMNKLLIENGKPPNKNYIVQYVKNKPFIIRVYFKDKFVSNEVPYVDFYLEQNGDIYNYFFNDIKKFKYSF